MRSKDAITVLGRPVVLFPMFTVLLDRIALTPYLWRLRAAMQGYRVLGGR